MSTQQLLIPRDATVQRSGRRIVVVTSIAAALFAGALIGRATAPAASSVAHPATLLTVGSLSQADAGRAEMFRAMNGLLPTAIIQPATTLDPRDVSSASSARLDEMFRAMNGLRHQQI